jgi:hypothetical protein
MKLNTLYTILAIIALGYGVVAVLLPGFLIQLLWPNPAGPEGYLLLQGWGSCLVAFSVIAWGARRLESLEACCLICLGFFTYFIMAAILWLVDALSRGWTIFSILTFALLVLFALGFGYFVMVKREGSYPIMQKEEVE